VTVRPTGEQYLLRFAGAEVVVVEVGGGLRSYRADGRDLLDGYGEREMAGNARGQVLAPWPNRLRDGRYRWNGEEHQTPQPGYPFALRLQVSYELSPAGLRVQTTATDEGDVPVPDGEGHHPYLAAGASLRVDDCILVAPGSTRAGDRRAGAADRGGRRRGHRLGPARRPIGDLVIDHCFTDLVRDDDGLAWVRLTGPGGRGAAVWLDAAYTRLQLFTGDVVPEPRRRRGLAVEPMTCPPNAFATGESVIRLEPGESTTGTWGLMPLG
jgi:aldose 1-epimerase